MNEQAGTAGHASAPLREQDDLAWQREHGLWSQCVLASWLCVNWDSLLNLSEPRYSHLRNGGAILEHLIGCVVLPTLSQIPGDFDAFSHALGCWCRPPSELIITEDGNQQCTHSAQA